MGPKKGGKKGKSEAGVRVIPPGYGPMVVTGHTKQLLGCEVGEGVTEEKPAMFIKREIMIEDIVNRAAVSDFAVFKKFIQAYPEEDMLLVFDPSFKYDAAYFLCLTIEAKDTILKELEPEAISEDEIKEGELSEEVSLEEKDQIEEEEEEEIEMILTEYAPLESKQWLSLGSEVEVEGEQVIDSRPKIKIVVSERDFLARKELELSDRSPSQYKELYLEIPPAEEVLHGIYRKTVDQGIQAVVLQKMSDSQTLTVKPINAWTQYEPRTYTEEEKIDILESEKLAEFAQKAEKRVAKALQQNIIADVFKDDWAALGDEECEFSAEQDNSLKEYQSFTYLQHKNMKMITCVNWHPDLKGVLASSCVESCSFEESADNLSNLLLEPCLVFVWSFADPILPQLLLEAPEEVNTIQFNPTVPYLLAGGCTNGQLTLWDLKQYEDKLQTPSEQSWIKKTSAFTLAALGDMQGGVKSPVLRYCASSNIDSSHMHGIYHIEWIPSHMTVGQKGEIELSTSPYCFQIVTCGLDGTLRIWDIRGKPPEGSEDNKLPKHVGHKSPYAALDMAWKPFHIVNIPRLESHIGVDLTCFALKVGKAEKANDTYLVAKDVTEEKDENNSEEKDSKPLISSVFFGGTETGKVIRGDWKFIKDETGNFFPPPPEYYTSIFDVTIHGGPIVSIEQSPFLNDVFFSIGGRSMGIWKEDLKKGPLLLKLCTSSAITTGNWSSTRPAVFYLGCEDGTLRLWDLVVTSHNAIMIQSVSSTHITSITTRQMSENEQVLAVGDRLGTIHIIALPKSLWDPVENELEILKKFIERECKRTNTQAKRRAKEQELKAEAEKRKADEEEAKKKVKPKSEEVIAEDNRTDEEKERDFCQAENEKYLALEEKVLLKLGFIEPEETAEEEKNESTS